MSDQVHSPANKAVHVGELIIGGGAQGRRLYGLDAWRALLLTLGPVYHACLSAGDIYGPVKAAWLLQLAAVLHSFRMESFFALSGFLMAYQSKSVTEVWLVRRQRQLFVPLLVAWLTVLPLVGILESLRAGSGLRWNALNPIHLWFLLVLLAITPVLWVFRRSNWSDSLLGALERKPALWLCGVFVVMLLTVAGRSALHFLPGRASSSIAIATTLAGSPYYLVFAVAGSLAAQSKSVMAHLLHGQGWIVGPITLAVYAFAVRYLHWEPRQYFDGTWTDVVIFICKILLPVLVASCMTYCILSLGVRAVIARNFISNLTEAAFTVYLFHPLPIELLRNLLGLKYPATAFFLVVAGGSLAISLAFHSVVIKPFAITRMLFNGQFADKKRAAL